MSDSYQLVSDLKTVKAGKPVVELLLQGVLAGAYIALVGAAMTMATYNLLSNPETFGLGRVLSGAIFPCALIIIVFTGAELFTGNTMMLLPLAQRRITLFSMLRNWGIVYTTNFAGAVTVALLIVLSGQLSIPPGDLLGRMTITIAANKCNFAFYEAFLLGIFCNWLVCLAVWMSISAKDFAGKVMIIFVPICVFVTAGFEHSIANMFFIPVGLFAAQFNPQFVEVAQARGVPVEMLTWQNFFIANLLPVTLGNIVGGGVCVGLVQWFINRDKK